jgi:hypothetical protein
MQTEGAWAPLSCKGIVRTCRFKVQCACGMLPRTGMDFVATMMHQGINKHACMHADHGCMHACMQIMGALAPLNCKGAVRTCRIKVKSARGMLPRTGMDFVATMMHQRFCLHAFMHACMQIM